MQPHLRKCFEAVHAITMTGPECEMSDMISPEKETVVFLEKLYPRGSVEVWMGEIETMMRRSVRQVIALAIEDYKTAVREEFCIAHASMTVIAVTQFYWTIGIEKSLLEEASAQTYYDKMLGQLQGLSLLVRQKVTKLQSKVLASLVVLEVHARDVVERLIEAEVSKTTDFEWISQLRYYWEETPSDAELKNWGGRNGLADGPVDPGKNMVVRMVQCAYPYGYEYLGASSRLVVTPLTDRCYMTLMGALHIKLGGAPAGPAGTGKTESVKDLVCAAAAPRHGPPRTPPFRTPCVPAL